MNVLVNQKGIRNEIKKCDNYVTEFNNTKLKIEKMVADIETIWKKEEYNNFRTEMDNFIKELEDFKTQLTSYNNFVKGYLEAEELLDGEYTNKKINIG